MIRPRGSKIIKIDWIEIEVLLITNKTQLKYLLKNNDIKKEILNIDEWESYSGKVVAFDNNKQRYYIFIIRKHNIGVIIHESVHLAEYILTDHDIKAKGETLAYMVEHIFKQVMKYPINK